MNSKERHELRYQRRHAKRVERDRLRAEKYTKWENIFGLEPLMEGYKATSKASRKRTSTQIWMSNLAANARKEELRLVNGTWKSRGFNTFTIKERGKWRMIQSVHISEKGIQNSLCNNCLIPILRPHLIYDNGASLKGKGTDFAIKRFTEHLRRHIRKHGVNGWIYFYDFSKYFSNIDNRILKKEIFKYIQDEKVMGAFSMFADAFGDHGLGLGSQISQISAVFFPNRIDHMIKDRFGVHGYARYMDDGYVIHHDLHRLKEIIIAFENECENIGIVLNMKKCRIISLRQPFVFLKTKFRVTDSGGIVKRCNKVTGRRERVRLRAFRRFLDMGLMNAREIYLNFHSWLLSLNRSRCGHVKYNTIRLYNKLFGAYKPEWSNERKNTKYHQRYRRLDFLAGIAAKGGNRHGFIEAYGEIT